MVYDKFKILHPNPIEINTVTQTATLRLRFFQWDSRREFKWLRPSLAIF